MIITEKENYINGSTVLAPQFEPKREKKKDDKLEKQTEIKNRNKRVKNKFKILRNIALTFLVGVILIGRYSKIYNLQKQLNTTGQNINTLNKENENLKVELVKFSNVQYIEEIATKKLQMVKPTKESIIYCDMKKEIFKYENNAKTENKSKENTLKNLLKDLF
ncbi:septum formation initiator family protein [Clostridium lundense]|uniref:septum formation initiator family protein n=1 Tax=Clostridium lundense TaxID=319475 RepID=UPI000482DD00|nr:cell division protein FtsL [Clostridium lundense]